MRKYPLFLALVALIGLAGQLQAIPTADKILVMKSRRQLMLLRDGQILKTYRISLGSNPVGAKTRRGDGKTPEGKYIIDSRNPYSKYHLGLHVSYPDSSDRAYARKLGVDPGGSIMIHGLPNGRDDSWPKRLKDWTAGCIAVSNAAIKEIWHAVPNGTPVEIRP